MPTTDKGLASETQYYRRGFGLKQEVGPGLRADYHSRIVDTIKAAGYRLEV